MRVLFVDGNKYAGGAQRNFFDLVCAMQRHENVEVGVAVPTGDVFDWLTSAEVKVWPIEPVAGVAGGGWLDMFGAALGGGNVKLRTAVREFQPDLIHANALPSFAAVRQVVRGLPLIWHIRTVEHRPELYKKFVSYANGVIVGSPAIGRLVRELVPFGSLSLLASIMPGVDVKATATRAEARQRLGIADDVPVLGMVADWVPSKRHEIFLEEARLFRAKYPQARFVVVGRALAGGSYQKALQKAFADIDTVWVSDCENAAELIPAFDVLIHPPTGEAFGRAIAEAMFLGVPVVARDSAGPSDLIEDGVSGFLVPGRRSNGDFCNAAVQLVEDAALREKIVNNARVRVAKLLSTETMAQQTFATYERLLRQADGARSRRPSSSNDDD